MARAGIRDRCRVDVSENEDSFVGIRCGTDEISVQFPLGFRVSSDDKELRRDILLLLSAIGGTTAKRESKLPGLAGQYSVTAFPIQAYVAVAQDFFSRGYYRESETVTGVGRRGKIHWGRTIKNRKAFEQDGNLFYLDFITRENTVSENQLITLIHEYCVYESLSKIGWLFTEKLPPRPRLQYHERLFRGVLTDKLSHAFNDRNRRLFRDMLAIVEYQGNEEAPRRFRYGTYRFEYVWEALVDRVYGIDDKKDYFPGTEWRIGSSVHGNSRLEQDTIMIHQGGVYILDAKYYKFGLTGKPKDLPGSSSVSKQITYGEYVAEKVVNEEWFRRKHGEGFQVYNAFLMPFQGADERQDGGVAVMKAGQALSWWKDNDRSYEKVQGILVDTKGLMKIAVRQDREEMASLAECIRRELE